MNYRAHLKAMRESRDSWLAMLNKDPDSMIAAEKIVSINAKIDFIRTMMILDGVYEED